MKVSAIFFILIPFGLFCTENGTGLITGVIFLIIGLIAKWIENGGLEPKIEVKPKDFWEWHYKDGLIKGLKDEDSRKTADAITRMNNCPIPSLEQKETISKAMGIKTAKMQQEERDRYDRVQVGKYYLLTELMAKYKNVVVKEREDGSILYEKMRRCYLELFVKYERSQLRFKNDIRGSVGGYNTCHRFKKNDVEIWNSLSNEEKNEALQWVQEYENRLLKETNDYVKNGINMPTIKKGM